MATETSRAKRFYRPSRTHEQRQSRRNAPLRLYGCGRTGRLFCSCILTWNYPCHSFEHCGECPRRVVAHRIRDHGQWLSFGQHWNGHEGLHHRPSPRTRCDRKTISSNVASVQGDVAKLADLDRLYETVAEVKGRFAASRISMRTRSNDQTTIGSGCACSSVKVLRQGFSGSLPGHEQD